MRFPLSYNSSRGCLNNPAAWTVSGLGAGQNAHKLRSASAPALRPPGVFQTLRANDSRERLGGIMGIQERRERERAAVRKQIVDAAEMIAADKGWDAVTIRAVAGTISTVRRSSTSILLTRMKYCSP